MFVQKDKDAGGLANISKPEELNVVRVILIRSTSRNLPGIAHHGIHGVAADSVVPSSISLHVAQGMIAGTAVNICGLRVRTKGGILDRSQVRVVGGGFPIQ